MASNPSSTQERIPGLPPGVYTLEVVEVREAVPGRQRPEVLFGVVSFRVLWSNHPHVRAAEKREWVGRVGGGSAHVDALNEQNRKILAFLSAHVRDRVYCLAEDLVLRRTNAVFTSYTFAEEPFVSPPAQLYLDVTRTLAGLRTQGLLMEIEGPGLEALRALQETQWNKLDEGQQRLLRSLGQEG